MKDVMAIVHESAKSTATFLSRESLPGGRQFVSPRLHLLKYSCICIYRFSDFLRPSSPNNQINRAKPTSDILLIFSPRSLSLKPKSLFSPNRTLSPSSRYAARPRQSRYCSRAVAMVDLPLADRPVSQSVKPCWWRRAERSLRVSEGCHVMFLRKKRGGSDVRWFVEAGEFGGGVKGWGVEVGVKSAPTLPFSTSTTTRRRRSGAGGEGGREGGYNGGQFVRRVNSESFTSHSHIVARGIF